MFRHEVSRKRAEVTKISPGDNQADLLCSLKSIDFRHLGQKVTRGAEHTCAVPSVSSWKHFLCSQPVNLKQGKQVMSI